MRMLDERVVALPLLAMEALLRSEKLKLQSENVSYTLALWWVFQQAYRDYCSASYATYFTKAAMEALLRGEDDDDSADAPLGIFHGLAWTRVEDGVLDLGIFLLNCFEDPALDAPDEEAWKGKDNDQARGFMFRVARGKIGGLELEGEETCKVSMGGSTRFSRAPPRTWSMTRRGGSMWS